MSAPVPDEAVRLVDDFAKKVASADSLSAGTPTGAYLSKVGIAAQEKESDARAALLAYIARVVKERDEQRTERDGKFLDKFWCCKVCDGEIPDGHTDDCDIWKLEKQHKDFLANEYSAVLTERDALRAELEQARKDAERYRWLRDVGNVTFPSFVNRPSLLGHVWPTSAAKVDAAIDAALAETRP